MSHTCIRGTFPDDFSRLGDRKSDSSTDESVSSGYSDSIFSDLEFRNLEMENLSLSDEPKQKRLSNKANRSHRKLCRSKAIYSRPELHQSNSADSSKSIQSYVQSSPHRAGSINKSCVTFMTKRNLEDLELLEKSISARNFSTMSLQIEPVFESCLE